MQIAYLENDLIRVGLLIEKGADIFEFTYKPCDIDFMWQSPISMRRPFVATNALPEGAFHDYYYGGWQEILPSAGWATETLYGGLIKACMEKSRSYPLSPLLLKTLKSK